MKPDAQRIAIGTVRGWKDIRPYIRIRTHDRINILKGRCPTTGLLRRLPDYLNDLNAIRESCEQQTRGRNTMFPVLYVRALLKVLKLNPPTHEQNEAEVFAQLQATAAQRAEAFLRCLNLWKDEP